MNEPPEQWEQTVREIARHFPYPPTPNLAARSRTRHSNSTRLTRLQLAIAILVVILLGGTFSVPSVRAGIAEFLQIGSVRIWHTPPKTTLAPGTNTVPLGESVTLAEAQAEVWYPIRLPIYPNGIGSPDEVLLLNPEEDGIQLVWQSTNDHPELRLTQFGNGFWVNKWGPALEESTPSVKVNGRYATWAPGPHTWNFIGTGGERFIAVPEGSNVLIWSAGNITYRLESTLPQAEAVQVAESLQ
jgi:hypothetical protein